MAMLKSNKVLISFLGVGLPGREYRTAKYKLDETILETKFIADFLMQTIKPDNVYLFGTPKSMWEEVYAGFSAKFNTYDEEVYTKFFNFVLESNSKTKIQEDDFFAHLSTVYSGITIIPKLIHYGLNNEELKNNAEKILSIGSEINKTDEVYIDITHAFRSIPMYALLLVGFLRQLKGINVKDIYYGMLEASSELKYAPVVSLSPLIELFDWISATGSFNSFGSPKGIIDLMNNNNIDKDTINAAQKWAYARQLNDNKTIKDATLGFVKKLDNLNEEEIPSELKLLKPSLIDFPDKVSKQEDEWQRLLMLARHNLESDNIGLAVLNLWDAVISRFKDVFDIKGKLNHENYGKISRFIRGQISSDDIDVIKALNYENIDIFINRCAQISELRNSIAHGNELKKEVYTHLVKSLREHWKYMSKELGNSFWGDKKETLKKIFKSISLKK
jgi:CRISPR-associated Csx2 family protein